MKAVAKIADEGCAILPAYREAGRIGRVVQSVLARMPAVLVVDDGSDDRTADEAREAGAVVVRHAVNRGKGAALDTGLAWAVRQGYDFVITLDADGQHDAEDIPAFIAEYRQGRWPVLLGNRMGSPVGMPRIRRWTNRCMSWILSRRMRQQVPDTQCGYRLYRCAALQGISCASARFDAESEILLMLAARGVGIGSVPIRVIYGDEKSKINPIKDTIRFFRMLQQCKKGRA